MWQSRERTWVSPRYRVKAMRRAFTGPVELEVDEWRMRRLAGGKAGEKEAATEVREEWKEAREARVGVWRQMPTERDARPAGEALESSECSVLATSGSL